jgi:cytochrome c5
MKRAKISCKLLVLLVIMLCFQSGIAQTVVVPADKKAKSSPLLFNDAAVKDGETVYNKNCVSCHGNPTKANYQKTMSPAPGDPAEEKFQKNSDGELFYKIGAGNAVMPMFKNVLSEEERWKLVGYIRSFNKNYKQPPIETAAVNLLTKTVRLLITFNEKSHQITISAKGKIKNDSIPLKGAEVLLYAKRYFGRLQIEKVKQTNIQGSVLFDFPRDLPGDKTGNIELIAQINDDIFGEVTVSKPLKIGIPTDKPSLTEKRAIWNVNAKAPIWILLTYTIVVIGVWAFLIFIILGILKIKKASKKNN